MVIDEDGLIGYDPDTGDFFRMKKAGRHEAGKIAGVLNRANGYKYLWYKKKLVRAHRLAWKIMTGEWPVQHIDHINGNRSDNRFSNLRQATPSQNQMNRKSTAKSGYRGVYYFERDGNWVARIKKDGKSRHLGYFDTPEKAAKAYDKAASILFGEYARLNGC